MKKLRFLKTSILILLSIFTASCSNSLDSMLDSYNGHFTPVVIEPVDVTTLTPEDPGFNPVYMLLDRYVVSDQAVLNLCAPPDCNSYKWEIQDPELGDLDPIVVKTMDGTTDTSQRFVVYVKDSRNPYSSVRSDHNGLKGAKSYRLGLTAYGNDGRKYQDYATLAVYKDYFFETGVATLPTYSVDSNAVLSVSQTVTSSARSVLPAISDIDSSELHYYLYAKNLLTGVKYTPFEVNIKKDTSDSTNRSGEFEFNLPKGCYWVQLMAFYETPSQTSYEYLNARSSYTGFATVDNRYNQSASFVLSPSSDSLVGWAKLKFYTMGWDFADAIYDGYSITTSVTDSEGKTVSQNPTVQLTKANLVHDAAPVNENYVITLSPGVYTLNVIFTKGIQSYVWKDDIRIVSSLITEAEIGIGPVIPTGLSKFKIYTNGWDFQDSEYSGFITSLSVTKKSGGAAAEYTVTEDFSAHPLTDDEPGSANFGLMADLGTYNLNVSFTRGSKTYTYSQSFTVEAGKTKTETVGIPPTIPAGTYEFKLYTDGWSLSDSLWSGYTAEISVTKDSGDAAVYRTITGFEAGNLTDTVPGSANFSMYAESGDYTLNVSFTNGSKTYTWSGQFTIEAGTVNSETDGITSPVTLKGS